MRGKLVALAMVLCAGLMGCTQAPVDVTYKLKYDGMVNVTTGDGEFGKYDAVQNMQQRESGTKIILGLITLTPVPEEQTVIDKFVAKAKEDKANAIIQLQVFKYTPGMLESILVSHPYVAVSGTAIKTK